MTQFGDSWFVFSLLTLLYLSLWIALAGIVAAGTAWAAVYSLQSLPPLLAGVGGAVTIAAVIGLPAAADRWQEQEDFAGR